MRDYRADRSPRPVFDLGRIVLAVLLGLVAIRIAAFGLRIASFTFTRDYQDSPYLVIGSVVLAVAALFAVAAWWTLSPARRPGGWLILALAALGALLLPALLTGNPAMLVTPRVFGPATDRPVQVALLLLAVGSAFAFLRQRRV